MNDPQQDALTWDNMTWQDIQAIGMALAERHPDENTLTLAPTRLTELVAELPGFAGGTTPPDDFLLSAITTAWISAQEGEDDASPYEYMA